MAYLFEILLVLQIIINYVYILNCVGYNFYNRTLNKCMEFLGCREWAVGMLLQRVTFTNNKLTISWYDKLIDAQSGKKATKRAL